MRVLSKAEALTVLDLSRQVHREGRALPPEIVSKKKEIEQATRNAELFMQTMRQVDMGMVGRVVNLKLELDTLYGEWTRRETVSLA